MLKPKRNFSKMKASRKVYGKGRTPYGRDTRAAAKESKIAFFTQGRSKKQKNDDAQRLAISVTRIGNNKIKDRNFN